MTYYSRVKCKFINNLLSLSSELSQSAIIKKHRVIARIMGKKTSSECILLFSQRYADSSFDLLVVFMVHIMYNPIKTVL